MNIKQDAQEMVDALAPLLSGRTVNIMDHNAVIIASSDHGRVGTFHQGAAEVMSSGKTVRIYKDALARYEGAKEGVNLPIVLEGSLFGVVGIYGDPDEVQDMANLLCVYVRQHFENAAILRREHLQSELRTQLLKMIIYGQTGAAEDVRQLSSVVGAKMGAPMRAIVVALRAGDDAMNRRRVMDKLPELLASAGLLDAQGDIYGVADDCFVWLHHTSQQRDFSQFLEAVHAAVCAGQPLWATTAAGEQCRQVAQLALSYREAFTIARSGHGGRHCIDNNHTKLEYLMRTLHQTDDARFLAAMYQTLQNRFGRRDIDWVMTTVRTFYDCGGSVNRAAQLLHIHKNTLLYRMNKVFSLLGLEEENAFTRECFLQLLLLHHEQAQDARAQGAPVP